MDAMAWKQTVGEPRALISRRALLHNCRVVRSHLPLGTRVCAIIKADAYGHGAAIVADTLCNITDSAAGSAMHRAVDALAVASLDEAAALPVSVGGASAALNRGEVDAVDEINEFEDQSSETDPGEDALRKPQIIIFRPVENAFLGRHRAKLEEAVRRRWVLTLCSPEAADDLARIAESCGRRAEVQIMVDSGMTRTGVQTHALGELVQKVQGRPSLHLVAVGTHFASADEPENPFTIQQFARFSRAVESVLPTDSHAARGVYRHAANSGAVFFSPSTPMDMVRPGLALLGVDPAGKPCLDRPLRPVLKWTAPLIGLKDVPAGETVGYGQTWRAGRPTRIGLLPVGYADGYSRSFSNKAVVLVHGRPAPVVGRISMDLTTIDLTEFPHAVIGDEVTLLDSDPLSPASIYKLAQWADTIPYEVFCRIGPRIRRVAYDLEDDTPRATGRSTRIAPEA